METKLARRTKVAMLVALSAVGAFIKIPSPTGTVALDSLPGYFGALVIGRKEGAMIAGLGHLVSAATMGFFLSIPVHVYIALQMAIFAYVFGLVKEKIGNNVAIILGVALNGVVAPALLIPLPGFGKAFFLAMFVPLLVASAVNIILASLVAKSFEKINRKNTISQ